MMCMSYDRQQLVCCPDLLSVKGMRLLLSFQFHKVDTTQTHHSHKAWDVLFSRLHWPLKCWHLGRQGTFQLSIWEWKHIALPCTDVVIWVLSSKTLPWCEWQLWVQSLRMVTGLLLLMSSNPKGSAGLCVGFWVFTQKSMVFFSTLKSAFTYIHISSLGSHRNWSQERVDLSKSSPKETRWCESPESRVQDHFYLQRIFLLRAKNHDAVFNYLLGNVDRIVQNWETIMLITYHFSYLETNHALTETQEHLEWLGLLRNSLKICIFRRGGYHFSEYIFTVGKYRMICGFLTSIPPVMSYYSILDTQHNSWR